MAEMSCKSDEESRMSQVGVIVFALLIKYLHVYLFVASSMLFCSTIIRHWCCFNGTVSRIRRFTSGSLGRERLKIMMFSSRLMILYSYLCVSIRSNTQTHTLEGDFRVCQWRFGIVWVVKLGDTVLYVLVYTRDHFISCVLLTTFVMVLWLTNLLGSWFLSHSVHFHLSVTRTRNCVYCQVLCRSL